MDLHKVHDEIKPSRRNGRGYKVPDTFSRPKPGSQRI